ncbi:MAG: response regulator transcription factor [Planctomycetes bacterium]|nr:response regulator transcription factor [Planctomycetota bacterium]
MPGMRVLLIEDNETLRGSLARGLASVGYHVDAAADGFEGWNLASEARHDLIILDRMLPGLDGLAVLDRLRKSGSRVPVLMLTACDGVDNRVQGLDAGADDYLTKPFAVAELLARMRALVRRGDSRADPTIAVGDLEIDTVGRAARRNGRRIDLTPKEYQALEYLAMRMPAVVTRIELFAQLYPGEQEAGSNVIDVLIGRLRRKLHPPGCEPVLHTRRGFGYQLGGEA